MTLYAMTSNGRNNSKSITGETTPVLTVVLFMCFFTFIDIFCFEDGIETEFYAQGL
jgi:hypothetical protein